MGYWRKTKTEASGSIHNRWYKKDAVKKASRKFRRINNKKEITEQLTN